MNAVKKPASPQPRGRGLTVVWAIIGMLCSAGVILAAVDPALTGGSSGSSIAAAPTVAGDDGFVTPPAPAAQAPAAPQEINPSLQAARDAHADQLIQNLITKMRKEREALRAERKRARELAQE